MWTLNNFNNSNFLVLEKVFTDSEIHIIDELSKKSKIETSKTATEEGQYLRNSKNCWIEPDSESEWLFRKFTDIIVACNSQTFRFDLTFIENFQYTVYDGENNSFYKKHIDMNVDLISPRKLSFSLLLSDIKDYEGGDLRFYQSEDPHIKKIQKGSIIFFPSFLLHEVTPVTSGTRKSLVGWVHGPAFK